MNTYPLRSFCVIGLVSVLTSLPALAQENAAAESAIRENAIAYTEAFNRGDAEALAAFWSPQGTWVDPSSGEHVGGRDSIQAGFEVLFAENQGAKLEVDVLSIKLLTDEVAIEEGSATITVPDSSASRSGYTAIHVKQGDDWLIDRVIESTAPTAAKNSATLDEIAWLEGSWIDESENSTIYFQNDWVAGGNFLRSTFTVMIEGRVDLSGFEIVGWDAAAGQLRSWVFDSDGSFAELKWSRQEDAPDKWIKKAEGTLSSGATVSAVHIMKRIDDDRYTFQSVARQRGSEFLPNIDEVTVVRASAVP